MIPDPDLIALAGDWHADNPWAEQAIRAAAFNDCQAIVHVGDFGMNYPKSYVRRLRHTLEETGLHLYFVRGNHDDPGFLDNWPLDSDGFGQWPYPGQGSDRIHYIPQGHRWTWWGQTFMGLGGAHSVDRQWRTPMVDWWPGEWISTADTYRAMRGGKVNVMITHDIPAKAKLPNGRKTDTGEFPRGEIIAAEQHRQILQSVVDEVQPDLLVHGHFHERYEQYVGQMHVVGLDRNQRAMKDNLYIIGPDMIERTYRAPNPADYPSERFIMDKAADIEE